MSCWCVVFLLRVGVLDYAEKSTMSGEITSCNSVQLLRAGVYSCVGIGSVKGF